MADEIKNCNKIIDENNAIVSWDFSYTVSDPNDANRINNFCVTVLASEMTDPTDASEAKTKANAKASTIKTDWLAQEVNTITEVAANVGSVTL